jgi:hypothetical protein
MTDARFPERWLHDRRILRLPDKAFRQFVTSLAWSVANRTEGVIERAETLPVFDAGSADALVKARLWEEYAQGWVITVFEDTQSTRAELEAAAAARRRARDKKRRQRARRADVPGDVPGDSTG